MSSIIKVDTIQDQAGNNIINESANVITIGASGDNITIPSGATFASVGIDDNATSTAITIDSSERVGVGTSPNANAKFHIRTSNDRNLYVRDGYRTVGGIAIQTVNNAESANVPLELNADAETLLLSGTPITFTNSGTERMRIDSSGNVGIGTSSPNAKLDISATGNNASAISTTVSDYAIKLASATTSNYFSNGLIFSEGNTAGSAIGSFDGGSSGRQGLWFATHNGTSMAERMRIDSSGNVGIGTTAPSTTLDIRSASPVISTVDTGDSNAVAQIDGNAGWLQLKADNNNTLSGTNITFSVDGSEKARLTSDGRLGIGTTSPSTPLQVNGTARASNFNTLSTQVVMSNSSQDWDISGVIGTIPNVEGSISFELTMRERSTSSNQLFRIYYIRVGQGTTFNISSTVWSVGSTAANTTISYPSAGTIRFTNSSFSVLNAQIRRISS